MKLALKELVITLLALGAAAAVLAPRRFDARRAADEAGAEQTLRHGLPSLGVRSGYRFGAIENGPGGGASYAVPEVYGVTGRLTLIRDAGGRVYAKDTGNAFPPGAWPAPDPKTAGWTAIP